MEVIPNAGYLTEIETRALAEIKRRVSALFPVRTYVLFGSKARGDFAPDSDADLLIIAERKLTWKDNDLISAVIFEVNLAHDTQFSMVAVSAEDWDGDLYKVLPLHRNVEREGVIV